MLSGCLRLLSYFAAHHIYVLQPLNELCKEEPHLSRVNDL